MNPIVLRSIVLLFSVSALASDESSDYQYDLGLAPAALTDDLESIWDDQYRSVTIELQNTTSRIVRYYIYAGNIVCPDEQDPREKLNGKVVRPRGSLRSFTGSLLPGSGSKVTQESVGMVEVKGIGILGPVDALKGCKYSLSVKFVPLNESDFSPEKSEAVSIGRTVIIE